MINKWLLLAISAAIIVIYSIFLRKYVKTETPFISWLSTMLSVAVAAFLGIFIFFFQNAQTDAQNKKQHLDLINAELRSNLEDISSQGVNQLVIIRGNATNTVYNVDLQDFCMTQAIQSRLFDEVETKHLYVIVNAIHKRRTILEYLNVLLQTPDENPENITQAVAALNGIHASIITGMGQLKQTLKITP